MNDHARTLRHDFVPDERRKGLREAILDFLRSPAASSGILVVCGPRGVGKTRLVDEFLNKRASDAQGLGGLLRGFVGDPERSARLPVFRQPRGSERIIVPVPVSPFVDRSDRAADGASTADEPEAALLRNVVFGLTNAVDPHVSLRRYGKTLRARLGWRHYWFSPTALIRHGEGETTSLTTTNWGPTLVLGLLSWWCGFIGGGLLSQIVHHWPQAPSSGAWLPAYLETIPYGYWLCLALLSGPVAWLLCRLWDWRALARFNDLLYDLIHAESSRLSETSSSQQPLASVLEKLSPLRLGGTLAALFGAGGLLSALSKGAVEGGGVANAFTQQPAITLGVGLAALVAARLLDRRKTHLQSEFSSRKTVWTINLLRRYLFLLHRCGIEPVLIIDELDKLEDAPTDSLDNAEQSRRHADNKGVSVPKSAIGESSRREGVVVIDCLQCAASSDQERKTNARLDDLLEGLARLKDSLGTEFLWILIGGPGLWRQLDVDRSPPLPGRLATTFPKRLVVRPALWDQAKEFLERSSDDLVRQKAAWLRGRGHYALMTEELRHLDRVSHDSHELSEQINWIWGRVVELTAPVDRDNANRPLEEYPWVVRLGLKPSETIHFTHWRELWLLEGILDLASRLLFERGGPVRYRDIEWRGGDIGLVLVSDDPKRLIRLGRTILYNELLIRPGSSDRGIPVPQPAPRAENEGDVIEVAW